MFRNCLSQFSLTDTSPFFLFYANVRPCQKVQPSSPAFPNHAVPPYRHCQSIRGIDIQSQRCSLHREEYQIRLAAHSNDWSPRIDEYKPHCTKRTALALSTERERGDIYGAIDHIGLLLDAVNQDTLGLRQRLPPLPLYQW